MPAINLIQLRSSLNDLLWNFTDPDAFRESLMDLLDHYAYTAYRTDLDTRTTSSRPEIQISQILLRELDLALLPVIHEQPRSALAICDKLWNDENMEICLISSHILGEIPIEHSDLVLDRVSEWALHRLHNMTIRTLLKNATTTIMRTDPEILLRRVRKWYVDPQVEKNNLCLEGMAVLVDDRNFENLPAIFTLLDALLDEATVQNQQSLYSLFHTLLQRSPQEMLYILRKQLQGEPNITVQRIARKLIPELPEASRESIKTALREASRKNKAEKEKE